MKHTNLWRAGMVLLLAGGLFLAGCSDPDPDGGGDAPAVTGVTIAGPAEVIPGATNKQYTATVEGTGNPAQTVTWTVAAKTGSTSVSGTAIAADGKLTIAAGQTAGSVLVITATSTVDTTKSDTKEVTVKAFIVTSVAVDIDTSISSDNVTKTNKGTLAKSGNNITLGLASNAATTDDDVTIVFAATVDVEPTAGNQGVTWTVTKVDGTALETANAALIAFGADANAHKLKILGTTTSQSVKVTATSAKDNTKSDSVVIVITRG